MPQKNFNKNNFTVVENPDFMAQKAINTMLHNVLH
jgi:hypothetical protein